MTLNIIKRRSRSYMEQRLLIFFITIISTCYGLPTETVDICRTPECVDTASRILKSMDSSVNPCDNFYKFTCGNFVNTTNIPDDKDKVDIFGTLSDQVQEQLKKIVEETVSPKTSKLQRLAKTFYDICMNETAIKENGLSPLLSKLNKLGGWPVLEGLKWKEDAFHWTNSIYTLREMGYSFNYLFSFAMDSDIRNNTNRVLILKLPYLGLNPPFLSKGLENQLVKDYKKYSVDVAVLLGADRGSAEREMNESLLFEIKLANLSLHETNNYNFSKNYNPISIAELEKKHPSIPWLEYINKLLKPSVTVDKNETVILSAPYFITEFEKLINTTSKRTQANFILWRLIVDSVFYLNDEIRKPQVDFMTAITGRPKKELRSKECLDNISAYLPLVIGTLYVKKYFNEDVKNNAAEIVNNIEDQLKLTLQTVDWMDNKTRKHALDKANAMINHIAYMDGTLDENKFEELYKNLELRANDSYLDTILNLRSHAYEINLKRYGIPIDKNSWEIYMNPTVVNAFYLHQYNIIRFSAAVLQGAFFNINRPRYINYGSIGFLIGHEITHGFDSVGMNFNKDGNLENWWEPITAAEYWIKATCLKDQYDNYTVEDVGKNVDGLNTITENIADNGGVKLAYLAYRNLTESSKPEPRLPGLDQFTPKQMFWISTGHTWCTVQRPGATKIQLIGDSHSPAEFRIVGSLSNMKEFSDDFKCPLDSPMNPKNKCAVW
ncbi:neprilysin-2-like [Microplitis mediator]|uniref:neprilysin-2-like n=1 Tax=Microplitis mediator TaxID=375433 RepID=UPI0025531EAF|nr:neprilysin-2-like [Microplitis mediator]